MQAVWRLGSATVDQVRDDLPSSQRSAYNTVQTVLNRLVERGLLERTRVGKSFQYTPLVSEAEYVAQSIHHALDGATSDVRRTVLAELLGGLEQSELSDLRRRAKAIERRRNSS